MNCGCQPKQTDPSTLADSTVKIDFLFLDESICIPCGGTAQALDDAISMLTAPLSNLGVSLQLEKIHVTNQEIATAEKFLSSPTIRVNGKDIDPTLTEEECPTCGDLAGGQTPVNCRNWHWRGEIYQAAPVGKIVEAIMEAALSSSTNASSCCAGSSESEGYELPDNLKTFFTARDKNAKTCC